MRSCRVAAAALAFGTCLGGCAATTTTNKVAVDYNRFFAQSRNEVLVTNILRASAREPMQFSTMGTVTGGVRNSGSITVPFTNLIGGTSGLTISPSATLNDSINPNITIVPLADKEFTEGILKPVSLDTLAYFLNQGWDPELILPLVVGGIICKRGKQSWLVLNRGQRHDDNGELIPNSRYDKFTAMFAGAPRLPIQPKGEATKDTIRMPTKDGIALLKDGIGNGRKIDSIQPVRDSHGQLTAEVDIVVSKAAGSQLAGLNPTSVCEEAGSPVAASVEHDPSVVPLSFVASAPTQEQRSSHDASPLEGQAILRSVESIIYFLGETQRDMWQSEAGCGYAGNASWPYYDRYRPERPAGERLILLRLERACSRLPIDRPAFVQTKFNDQYYFVRRSADAGRTDRSLTTLSFLNELISLQVSGSTITSTAPVIAVGAR
jgi:hypothetical protein